MKKYILFLSLFCLACLMWQCGDDDGNGGNVQPDLPAPTITSFTPTTGSAGTTVTVTGTNFSTTASSNIVKFNGKTATVTSATATSINTTVPVNAGVGKITVEVAGKTATSASDFTFIRYTTVSTFVGSGQSNIFDNPRGVVQDANGDIYLADSSNEVIKKITPQGVVTTFAGTVDQAGTTDGTGAAARFSAPIDITMSGGNFYIVDYSNNRIRKMTPQGVVTTLAGSTSGSANGIGTNAQFNAPTFIVADNQGNLFVTETRRIRKIVISTGEVTTFAGSGNSSHADGTGTAASFTSIQGMCIDAQNNLFVMSGQRCIRKITPAGVVTTFAGAGNQLEGYVNGSASVARFIDARAIAIDNAGFLYVLQVSSIRKVSPQGDVTDFAGINAATYLASGDVTGSTDGNLTDARFNFPDNIYYGQNGVLYVIERHKIRKID